MLAQVVSTAARRAEQVIEPDREGDTSCYLYEAVALITGNAGQRLNWAARSVTREGDIQGPRWCTRASPRTG